MGRKKGGVQVNRISKQEREVGDDSPLIINVVWEGDSKTNQGLVQIILP